MFLITIALAILTPLMARLFYFAISRKREYLADACATRLTRYPEGLASALEQISSGASGLSSANRVTAPMFIVNPLQNQGMGLSSLTSTHPPIKERVQILRSLAHGAGLASYQDAFSRVTGRPGRLIPPSGLSETGDVPIRQASPEEPASGKKTGLRDVGDLMRAANRYAFLICACGLRMKIPPDFDKPQVSCPRCHQVVDVPLATMTAAAAAIGAATGERGTAGAGSAAVQGAGPEPPRSYSRRGTGWETLPVLAASRCRYPPRLRAHTSPAVSAAGRPRSSISIPLSLT